MTEVDTAPLGLRRNAIGLTSAIIMGATILGPAVSTFFNPQFSTPFSGYGTPFVYLICLIAMIFVASGIMEMSADNPSAGGFYTFVTRGLGPRSGFVTGGLMFMAYALLAPIEIGLIGAFLQTTFQQQFGVNIPWVFIGLVPAILMIVLAFNGIHTSLRTALVLFAAEVAVVVGMALIIVAHGGAHGLTLKPLTPSASLQGFKGIVTGAVYAALSFVGFEGAAMLGEEVKRPRRNVPLGVLFALLLVGGIYVFCVWAEMIGLGPHASNQLNGSSTPWNTLADMYASWMTWPIIIASVSSMFAVMVSSNNGIVRILYCMSREDLLPKPLAHIHERHRTPSTAVLWEGAFAIAAAVILGVFVGGLGNPIGGDNVYGYFGFILTLALLPVYVLTNVACLRYFRRKGEFRWYRHALFPMIGSTLMIGLLVGQIIEQSSAPYTWMPWVDVVWVVIVTIAAIWLGRTRPDVLNKAGRIMGTGDTDDGAAETAIETTAASPEAVVIETARFDG